MNAVVLERVASLIAAGGSIWFTNEITHAYQRLYLVLPPTGGPTEVIGLATLLWIWAKYQRYQQAHPVPVRGQRN
jgi:hypothetical protein